QVAYESFGDVVTFDTTYLTNAYKMPFALFAEVNHHGHSILLGYGLLINDVANSLVLTFLKKTAIRSTDVLEVIHTDISGPYSATLCRNFYFLMFIDDYSRYGYLFLIKEKSQALEKFKIFQTEVEKQLGKVIKVVRSDRGGLMEKYALYNNEWLSGLYKERHCWIPTFVKDSFWARISTTQRRESTNAFFFYGYANIHTTLKQFVEQYNNALRSKAEKEKLVDYNCFNTYTLITHYNIEKQFQEAYTNDKDKEVQEEFRKNMYCHSSLVKEEGTMFTYNVLEEIEIGEGTKDVIFKVDFKEEKCVLDCICHFFEFRGIFCRHALAVL
ncbi:LOW QUALITY PROTEIN: rve domain-containing protein/SWIM domain-containing protein, partial [Cephalotus follicularis]